VVADLALRATRKKVAAPRAWVSKPARVASLDSLPRAACIAIPPVRVGAAASMTLSAGDDPARAASERWLMTFGRVHERLELRWRVCGARGCR
jgi:hypothetical protein